MDLDPVASAAEELDARALARGPDRRGTECKRASRANYGRAVPIGHVRHSLPLNPIYR